MCRARILGSVRDGKSEEYKRTGRKSTRVYGQEKERRKEVNSMREKRSDSHSWQRRKEEEEERHLSL